MANTGATEADAAGAAVVDLKKAKPDFDLHILLVQKMDGLKKSEAVVKAYCEGAPGLHKRLGKS